MFILKLSLYLRAWKATQALKTSDYTQTFLKNYCRLYKRTKNYFRNEPNFFYVIALGV